MGIVQLLQEFIAERKALIFLKVGEEQHRWVFFHFHLEFNYYNSRQLALSANDWILQIGNEKERGRGEELEKINSYRFREDYGLKQQSRSQLSLNAQSKEMLHIGMNSIVYQTLSFIRLLKFGTNSNKRLRIIAVSQTYQVLHQMEIQMICRLFPTYHYSSIIVIFIIMFSLNELMQAFDNNLLYAWEILYADILMQCAPVSADYLRQLVMLYSKGIEKCSHLQNSQDNYFKLKIDQLMGQRKVIQCLHEEKMNKRKKYNTGNSQNTKGIESERSSKEENDKLNRHDGGKSKTVALKPHTFLQARKRQIEMRLAYDIEQSRTSKVSKMLKQQSVREEKFQGMVLKCISSQQEKLNQKIQQRRQRASISGRMAASLKLNASVISTCTYGEPNDSFADLDAILDQIPFLTSTDPDL